MFGRELALPLGSTPRHDILGSIYFDAVDAQGHLLVDPAVSSQGNSRKRGVFSTWIKRSRANGNREFLFSSYYDSNHYSFIEITAAGQLRLYATQQAIGSGNIYWNETIPGSGNGWQHIVVSWDSTYATALTNTRAWMNGVELTSSSADLYNQNLEGQFGGSTNMYVGIWPLSPYYMYQGYMADILYLSSVSIQSSTVALADLAYQMPGTTNWVPKDLKLIDWGQNDNFSYLVEGHEDWHTLPTVDVPNTLPDAVTSVKNSATRLGAYGVINSPTFGGLGGVM